MPVNAHLPTSVLVSHTLHLSVASNAELVTELKRGSKGVERSLVNHLQPPKGHLRLNVMFLLVICSFLSQIGMIVYYYYYSMNLFFKHGNDSSWIPLALFPYNPNTLALCVSLFQADHDHLLPVLVFAAAGFQV